MCLRTRHEPKRPGKRHRGRKREARSTTFRARGKRRKRVEGTNGAAKVGGEREKQESVESSSHKTMQVNRSLGRCAVPPRDFRSIKSPRRCVDEPSRESLHAFEFHAKFGQFRHVCTLWRSCDQPANLVLSTRSLARSPADDRVAFFAATLALSFRPCLLVATVTLDAPENT